MTIKKSSTIMSQALHSTASASTRRLPKAGAPSWRGIIGAALLGEAVAELEKSNRSRPGGLPRGRSAIDV